MIGLILYCRDWMDRDYCHNTGTMCGKAEAISGWIESLGKSQGQNPRGCRPRWFWSRDFSRESIQQLHPRLFHTFSFLRHPGPVKGISCIAAKPNLLLGSIIHNTLSHLKSFIKSAVPPIRLFILISVMPLKRCMAKLIIWSPSKEMGPETIFWCQDPDAL